MQSSSLIGSNLSRFKGMVQLLKVLSLFFSALAFLSCGQDSSSFQLEVGKKYPLQLWPDSAYFAAMDSIVFHENVRAPDAPPPEVSINPMMSPINPIKGKSPNVHQATQENGVQKAVEAGVGKRQEAFARRFQAAMDKLLSHPEDASLFQMVEWKEGEDLLGLLVRVYGKDAAHLPSFVVKSQVQSLNGGKASVGMTIKLPQLTRLE